MLISLISRLIILLILLFCIVTLTGCNQESEQPSKQEQQKPSVQESESTEPPLPPTPPIIETFDAKPQLSLFPRIGGTRPADDDKEQLAYWRTFIDHLKRTSGVAQGVGVEKSNCWVFRGNDGVISLGFFSPLEVQPSTSYRVSFDFQSEMPVAGEAGIGILEFKDFFWIADQFTEDQLKENLLLSQKGATLTGNQTWTNRTFDFTTTPKTKMIHIILFREGEQNREPIFFDNIRIEPITTPAAQTTVK